MNRRQIYFLLAGVCLFALSFLFPAWLYEDQNTSAVRSGGYHFRYSKPRPKLPDDMPTISGAEPTGNEFRIVSFHVDAIRELGATVALFCLTLGAILVSVQRPSVAIHIVGRVFVFAGVGVLAVLIFYVFFLLS